MKNLLKKIAVILAVISIAVTGLTVYSSAETLDADGTYSVDIYLWNSSKDKASMAKDAIVKEAKIVVADGVKTMYIETQPMTMMGITASLQELEIDDGSGNYTSATVTEKDSSGNPTGFSFVLPHTEEYITVKVNPHIALMANQAIGARIKVDYSTLTLTEAAAKQTTEKQTVTEQAVTQAPATTQPQTTATAVPEYTVENTEASTEAPTEEATTEAVAEDITEETENIEELTTEEDAAAGEEQSSESKLKVAIYVISGVASAIIASLIVVIIFIKKKKN